MFWETEKLLWINRFESYKSNQDLYEYDIFEKDWKYFRENNLLKRIYW
jgi:hypothetical protein